MKSSTIARFALVSLACAWFASAHADETTDPASKWKVSIGPGLVVTPKYPGSSKLDVIPLPSLDISYDDRIFSQGFDVLGVNALKGDAYHVGAAISFDLQSRSDSDDPRLRGLGNVHTGPKLKLFADYSVSFLTGSVAAYQDIAGNNQGLYVSTDLAANLPVTADFLVSFGPGFTWANAQYTRTFFGVSAQQSAASGLPAYDTSSGIRDIHLNAYTSYNFTKHWIGSVAATVGRLRGDAGRSPVTVQRTEVNVFAGLNYRF